MKKLEWKSPVVIAAIVVACLAVPAAGVYAIASSGSNTQNEPATQEEANVKQAALKTDEKGTVVTHVNIEGWRKGASSPVSVIVTVKEAGVSGDKSKNENVSSSSGSSSSSDSLSSVEDNVKSGKGDVKDKGRTFTFDANSDKHLELDSGVYSFEFGNVLLEDGTLWKAPAASESVTVKPGEEVKVNPKYTKVSADDVTEADLNETVEQLAAVDAGAAEKAVANAGATAAGSSDSWTPPAIDKNVKPSGDSGSGSGSNSGSTGGSNNNSGSGSSNNNGGSSTPAPSPEPAPSPAPSDPHAGKTWHEAVYETRVIPAVYENQWVSNMVTVPDYQTVRGYKCNGCGYTTTSIDAMLEHVDNFMHSSYTTSSWQEQVGSHQEDQGSYQSVLVTPERTEQVLIREAGWY